MKTKNLSKAIKICLYYQLIVSIAVYVREILCLKKEDNRKLIMFENNCLGTVVEECMNHIWMIWEVALEYWIKSLTLPRRKDWSSLVTCYAKTMPVMSSIHTRMTLPTDDTKDNHQINDVT